MENIIGITAMAVAIVVGAILAFIAIGTVVTWIAQGISYTRWDRENQRKAREWNESPEGKAFWAACAKTDN